MLNKKIKTYVINLDKRPDRLSDLKLPLAWERFSATDGQKYINNIPKERGWRGCYDSHTRLIKKIISENYDLYIVFEDDVDVSDDFMDKLSNIINNLPENWELLFLGGWNVGKKIKINDNVDLAKKVYCMHAYVFKPETAKKLLNKFRLILVNIFITG